jgi:hypothetical protein
MPGLFAGARLSLQAQPFGGAADNQDFGERPAVNVVAGGTVVPAYSMGEDDGAIC